MGWFGESWGAPACDPSLHVETPVGARCAGHEHLHGADCWPLIGPNDQGITLPHLTAPGVVETVAYHLDCWLHEIGA